MRDKENIECNFKDVYRKMVMKNLKSKKKIAEPWFEVLWDKDR